MAAGKLGLFVLLTNAAESSSSSDDEDIIPEICRTRQPKKKIKHYLYTIYGYLNDQFKNTFRVTRRTSETLIEKFSQTNFYTHYAKTDHGGSPPISGERHILSFLWFASNKCALRDVAERFDVGDSTLFRMINRVMDFLVNLATEIIRFPKTVEEKERCAKDFYSISGFPNVLGCVDGTSIPIRTPVHKIKSTYCNRHDLTAVTLQGICDSNKKFVDIFTGPPGKVHDCRVFKMSFISQKLPTICEEKYHILGDSAYAIREWLLTPYRDYGNLTNRQKIYNKKFSATRVLIENTFGLLKNRFRQLLKLEFTTVDKITKFIVCCCVIHNICIDCDDYLELGDIENFEQNENRENLTPREAHLKRLGELKRDRISDFLNTN